MYLQDRRVRVKSYVYATRCVRISRVLVNNTFYVLNSINRFLLDIFVGFLTWKNLKKPTFLKKKTIFNFQNGRFL